MFTSLVIAPVKRSFVWHNRVPKYYQCGDFLQGDVFRLLFGLSCNYQDDSPVELTACKNKQEDAKSKFVISVEVCHLHLAKLF